MVEEVRASHLLIKHAESRNPISRRTDESTEDVSKAKAEAELRGWLKALQEDTRPMPEKFASLAAHRSDCGSFQNGGDLGTFGRGGEPLDLCAHVAKLYVFLSCHSHTLTVARSLARLLKSLPLTHTHRDARGFRAGGMGACCR